MSSEKTSELGLHKWAPPDYVQRTEFNDNFGKIDEHAKQVTEQLVENVTEIDKTKTKFKPRTIRPIVTFSFDDGTNKEYSHTYPLIQSKGIKVTSGIIANRVGASGFMSQSQILELKASGWEIASHSKTHTAAFTTLSDADLEMELKDSKEILNGYGFGVKNILIPFGPTDERVMRESSKYYRAARVSGSGTTGDYNTTPINTFRLNSILVGDTTGTSNGIDPISGFMVDTLNHWKYWVDQAIAKNLWIIFISHSDVVVANNRLADLGLLIDYVKSKQVEIVTIDEGLDIFENSIESKGFKVGADGKISGQYGKTKQSDNDSILNATTLPEAETGMLTFNVVTGGNRIGFPTTKPGGTLVTLKPDNDANRSFQLYKPYGSDDGLFIREYAPDPKPWKDLERVYVWASGSLAPDHSSFALKEGKVNFATIPTANASGWPENSAGFLTAYKLDGEYSSIYETYKLKNSLKIYTRYWDTVSAKWSDWLQQLNTVQLNSGTFTPTTPVDAFPVGTSFKQITQGESSGFPENTAGLLETRNIMWNGYKFQYYHILNTTKTYKRVWKTDATWSSWTQVNA